MKEKNRTAAQVFRRLPALLLAAMFMMMSAATGENALRSYTKEDGYVYLRLGQYPQTADGGVEPILWRVLTVDDEKAYLLSESFAEQAFTEEDLSMLLECENFGKVFLVTRDEMKDKKIGLSTTLEGSTNPKKIETNPGVRAWGTEWAIKNNGYPESEYPDPKAKIRNATDTANITVGEKRLYVFMAKYGACSPWWGRSAAKSHADQAVCTKDGGQIGRIEVGRDNEGVRPALYLAEGSYEITGGSGTKDDPFEIAPAGAAE